MDRLRLSRTPIRTSVTKTVNDVDAELAADQPSLLSLQGKLEKLDDLLERIAEVDQKILDAMLDENCSVEQIEQEYVSTEEYRDKIRMAKLTINRLFNARAGRSSPTASEYTSATSASGQQKKRNFKLPKIELRKFNGDLKSWLGFWSQFQKIDEDDTLHATDKFQYLVQSMQPGSEAHDVVNSYPQTGDNYPKAVEALKERFGRESLLVQIYIRELLKLVITNVTAKDKISLSQMYLKLESHLRALSSLNLATADPSTWLFPLVESSLPEELLRAWQRSSLSKKDGKLENPPKSSLDYLMQFIKAEVQSEQQIELAQTGFQDMDVKESKAKKTVMTKEARKNSESSIPTAAGLFAGHSASCIFCDKPHESKDCGKASEMTLDAKNNKIKEKNACYLCLRTGHGSRKCKAFVKCIVCKKRHPTLMCPQVHQKLEVKSEPAPPSSTHDMLNCTNTVMLQTLNVLVVNQGRQKSVRALCDPGAQKSYILQKTAEDLRLPPTERVKLCHYLFGGSSEIKEHNKYMVHIESENGEGAGDLEVLDQRKICGSIPRMTTGPWMEELRRKKIWVPDIGPECPVIELLIGSDYYGQILTGKRYELQNGLVALETKFGWTLSGKLMDSNFAMAVTTMHVQQAEVSELWDLERLGIQDPSEMKSKKEQEEETKQHFLQTVTRSQEGRYCVKLPWIHKEPQIPNNKAIAESRLMAATRKLQGQGQFDTYNSIFEGWITEGFIEPVHGAEIEKPCHYLPHRPVFKPISLTTPVRPVFDASCKTNRSPSLNECLEKGPNLMELIPSILLRFRENRVGVISDIRKAFQMIDVDKEDQDFLRFLWWENHEEKIVRVFRHKRVVFGVNCSPYLLAAVLEHHLNNAKGEAHPVAGKLLKSLYVDNCVASVHNLKEYEEFREISTRLLAEAKMELRQWEYAPANFPNGQSGENMFSSVLGLTWNKTSDSLGCDLSLAEIPETVTKRKILSTTHKIFDPIGFTAPALIKPKLILQEAWAADVDWDEELQEEMASKFLKWYEEVECLKQISIPRCINPFRDKALSIHCFCDASQDAYAAVLYLRSSSGENTTIRFLQAKARIAPLKRIKDKNGVVVEKRTSIPRLELLACTIGARLTHATLTALNWENVPCHFWSDSTTALSWIHRNDDWGTFVGNRVQEILGLSNPKDWRHVRTWNLQPCRPPIAWMLTASVTRVAMVGGIRVVAATTPRLARH